jgi:hypothetical protein
MDNTLVMEVSGSVDEIEVRQLSDILSTTIQLLDRIELAETAQKQPAWDWYLDHFHGDRLKCAIKGRPKSQSVPRTDPDRILSSCLAGANLVAHASAVPDGFSMDALSSITRLGRCIRGGVRSVELRWEDSTAQINADTFQHAKSAALVIGHEVGSLVGRLDSITDRKRLVFQVFDVVSRRPVRCSPAAGLDRDLVLAAFGHRVEVVGSMRYNGSNDLLGVDVQELIVLPADDQLPTIESMFGRFPDLLGELTVEAFIDDVRGRR